MRKRLSALIFTGGATAALTVGLVASPALAATWTVKPGGAFTAKSGTTVLTDKNTGNKLTCSSSKTSGTLKSGKGLSGTGIGSVKTISFTNCVGQAGLTFTVTPGHLPWKLNATSFSSGVTTGTITGIHAKLSGSGCTATVDGTGASANNGKVKVKYTNSTGKLKVLATGGNLHVYNVSGCLGLINSGDATTYTATYTVSPKQTITSP